jgi:hypothetical protein
MSTLARFPNYGRSLAVDEVHVDDLPRAVFHRDYVLRNRPLLIGQGAKAWPAAQWTVQTLLGCLRDVDNLFENAVGLVSEPFGEYVTAAGETARAAITRGRPKMSGAEFVNRLMRGDYKASAYGVPLQRTPGIERIWREFGDFPFLGAGIPKSFLYEHRMFIYRGGYTDWHFHYADEGLTAQFMGRKEVLLLSTESSTFNAMWGIVRRSRFSDGDLERDAAIASLRPCRAVLEPADILYIPVFWWHAVEPLDDEIGVTCAFTFKSPAHIQWDLRFRAARWNLLQAVGRPRFWPLVPLQALGAVWSIMHSPFAAAHLDRKGR